MLGQGHPTRVGASADKKWVGSRGRSRLRSGNPNDSLLEASPTTLQFLGVEPADNLRSSAAERTKRFSNAKILNGKFEDLPLGSHSVDYIYSLVAFHWVTDLEKWVSELSRVFREDGEIDIIFSGRETGKEFIRKTTPVLFKHLSPKQIMDAALSQQRLTVETTKKAFGRAFSARNLTVSESYHTYYDS
jgi:ubiquinone/menaquinone biosynthesis C-methylase UbiE